MNYQVNDIVITGGRFRVQAFVITKLVPTRPKNCYDAMRLPDGKPNFMLSDEAIAVKLGTADPACPLLKGEKAAPPERPAPTEAEVLIGQQHCRVMAALPGTPTFERERWLILAEKRPGDKVRVLGRGEVRDVTFEQILTRSTTYVFSALDPVKQRTLRYALSLVALPQDAVPATALFGTRTGRGRGGRRGEGG